MIYSIHDVGWKAGQLKIRSFAEKDISWSFMENRLDKETAPVASVPNGWQVSVVNQCKP